MRLRGVLALAAAALAAGCMESSKLAPDRSVGPNPELPAPNKSLIPTVHVAEARGWPEGRKPTPAQGLTVTAFATALDHPRWIYVLPNGDVLVAESDHPPQPEEGKGIKGRAMQHFMKKAGAGQRPSANRITLLRDADGDGVAETKSVFLANLNSPIGMALIGAELFVANADGIVKVPYNEGATKTDGPVTKVADLPGGPRNHHWTKNIHASRDGTKLYATVGSNSNVAENGMQEEDGRAAIWEVDVKTGAKRLFATGLRNPNGLAWEPTTGVLWTVVNERDELGSDLVPDYLTSVKEGAFYGWPYSYWGQNVDDRVQPANMDLVKTAVKPDYALGNHVAPLGLTFAEGANLGAAFASGAFVGEHGSWNRRPFNGYKVVFIPFANGAPAGNPVDVLTGFVDGEGHAMGRPVGVAIDKRGGLLVADDAGNAVWRVASPR
jgi:glucose/arabinose dehydrogenase